MTKKFWHFQQFLPIIDHSFQMKFQIISFNDILVTSLALLRQTAFQKMCRLKPIGINIPLVEVTQKNLFAYKLQDSFFFL